MRILFISPDIFSFHNYRLDLVTKLIKLGNEVILISPIKVSDDYRVVEIKKVGLKIVAIKLNKNKVNPFEDIFYIINLIRYILKLKPNIIFSYTIKPVIYSGISLNIISFINKKRKIYSLSMITGLGFIYSKIFNLKALILKPLIYILYKISLIKTNAIIFQNKDDLKYFSNKKILNKKIKKVCIKGSGVDLEKFKLASLPNEHIFLMTSRLLIDKGVREYVNAARLVKEIFPDTKFYLAGSLDSNPNSISKSELDDWITSGLINHLGFVKSIEKVLAKCRYFVLPSYYPEGIPRSILEAMAIGRPIITTNMPGCKETVVDKKNGFLVPPKNVERLVEKMIYLINSDENLIKEMGMNSRNLVMNNFEMDLINDQIINLLPL